MKKILLLICICFYLQSLEGQNNYFDYPSPYLLTLKKEMLTGGLSLAAFFAGKLAEKKENTPPFEPGSFTREYIQHINFIDRSIAGRWDLTSMNNSDWIKSSSKIATQVSLFLFPGNVKTRVNLLILYLEGYYLTNGMTSLVKGVTGRYRPFAYLTTEQINKLDPGSKAKFLDETKGIGLEDSFFSGHASSTAYSLIFLANVFNDYFPDTDWKYGMWGVCLAGVVLEDYFRVKSGAHFPTDVLAGSLAGGLIGFGIPCLHRNLKSENLSISAFNDGLRIIYSF